MGHLELAMTGTIDERAEGTPAYTKPFEMEYVPQESPYSDGRSPFNDLSIWPFAARVYIGGVCVPDDEGTILSPTDYECFSPTLVRYAAEELLGGCEKIEFRFGPGCVEFTFTKRKDGYYNVSVKNVRADSDFDETKLPPVVTVSADAAAYQFAKILSEHYKDMARFNEIELLRNEKLQGISLFSEPEIIRGFKLDGNEAYDFEGVPDPMQKYTAPVLTSRLEEALEMLDACLEPLIEQKKVKNDNEVIYTLKSGKQLRVWLEDCRNKELPPGMIDIEGEKKLVHFEYRTSASQEDENLFDVIANIWNKDLAKKSWADW